jgi:hypothetical protein
MLRFCVITERFKNIEKVISFHGYDYETAETLSLQTFIALVIRGGHYRVG